MAGCGSSGNSSSGLLSTAQSQQLTRQLDTVRLALGNHDCATARSALYTFQSDLNQFSRVDSTLVSNLDQGASTIQDLTTTACAVASHPAKTRTRTQTSTTTTTTTTATTDTYATTTTYTQPSVTTTTYPTQSFTSTTGGTPVAPQPTTSTGPPSGGTGLAGAAGLSGGSGGTTPTTSTTDATSGAGSGSSGAGTTGGF